MIKATLSVLIFFYTLSYTSLANNLRGKPIIPVSNESIVSIARWVFPVFVGPRTAVILFFFHFYVWYNFFFTLPDIVAAIEQK